MAHGVMLALAAALAFGATIPLVQRWGHDAGPFWTAALVYAGAALASLRPRAAGREARLRRSDVRRLVVVAVFGAVVAPVALAWGLRRTSGASAAMMLNLEAALTIALGRVVYREPIGRRVLVAAVLIGAGAAILIVEREGVGGADALGLAATAVATLGWALDNALSRPFADRDPSAVVLAKATLGAALSVAFALPLGDVRPRVLPALGLAACGAIGFGLSLRMYLLAQRRLGAARTASVFAIAPFVGAVLAIALGQPSSSALVVAGAMMGIGVWLHATELHAHWHEHDVIEHEHAHRHDDEHHDHAHEPMPVGEHSHTHRHEPRAHAHAHGEDSHHRHH